MKRFFHCFVLIMALLLPLTSLIKPTFAMAEDNCGQVLMYDDGSYIIITIEDHRLLDDSSVFATKSTKSGSKNYSYYDNSNQLMWVFRVHGTFVYDGVSASATGSSYSYDIYNDGFLFIDGNASHSGATATATGSFKRLLFPNSVTVSLTCSPTGVLS